MPSIQGRRGFFESSGDVREILVSEKPERVFRLLHEVGESESFVRLRKISKHLIYGLRESGSKEIRYIGKSSIGLSRPRSHFSNEKLMNDGYPVHLWTKSLVSRMTKPEIVILQEFLNFDSIDAREKNDIVNRTEIREIAEHRSRGHRLLNMTDGGDGLLGRSGEKHPMFGRRGEKSPRFGMKHTIDVRRRMSEALAGKNHPQFGIPKSHEVRQKIGKANRGEKNGMWGRSPTNFGKNLSDKQKENLREKCGKKVVCVNDGRVFRSQIEAAKFYEIDRNTVGQLCRGSIEKNADGLMFRFYFQ